MIKLQSYEEFVKDTRIRTNYALNRILWYFLITGPAIALGIWAGIFNVINPSSCLIITAIILALALTHLLLCKKKPDAKITSYFALVALDILLVYMANSHVGIYLTYCLVPALSLLYCDRKIFLFASVVNYIAMGIATYTTSPFYSSFSLLYPKSLDWFINYFGGYTIESVIVFFAASTLSKFATSHLKKLYENQHDLEDREIQISDQLDILKPMSEVYQTLNLVDLENEMISGINEFKKMEKISINEGARSSYNSNILKTILYEYKEPFSTFTDLSTLRERMKGKKKITLEIRDSISGWLRCQYICIGESKDGIVNKVVYTIENVNEEKRREERLIHMSNTDELTKLYNRRSYENDVKAFYIDALDNNFVIFSVDINGLKQTNDTLGHDAGDQLIIGAAACLLKVFGNMGKIYRVGGDEFIIMLHRFGDVSDLKQKLVDTAANWSGSKVKKLTFSIGYACKCNNLNATYKDLEREADKMMYHDKELFYSQRGTDRRGVQVAYNAICDSYEKILKIDIEKDTFKIIKILDDEKDEETGYNDKLSEWLKNFGSLGFMHPDDLEEYNNRTDINYLRDYFSKNDKNNAQFLKIFYRRRRGDDFHHSLMEIASVNDNSNEFFLYVKNIDK